MFNSICYGPARLQEPDPRKLPLTERNLEKDQAPLMLFLLFCFLLLVLAVDGVTSGAVGGDIRVIRTPACFGFPFWKMSVLHPASTLPPPTAPSHLLLSLVPARKLLFQRGLC